MDALPWWKLRMYVEGLNHEFSPPEDDAREDAAGFVSDHVSDFGLKPESLA